MARGETYEEFVAKFSADAPKTTDDCYTPQAVYEAVKEYALKLAGLDETTCTPIRPFYPGGDYQNYEYPADAYVIDNPPFSILSEIRRFYMERGIKYFLFAPALMCIRPIDDTIICAYSDIIYSNGATVKTSFVTNAANREFCLMSAPELRKLLDAIFRKDRKIYGKENTKKLKTYISPKNTFSSRDIALISRTEFMIRRTESRSVSKFGSIRQYGGAFLLSDRAAAELEKAREAAELEKAREAAELDKKRAADEELRRKDAIQLNLSPEQEEIVKQLNEKHK